MEGFEIRRATRKDSRAFLHLLDGLADFEHLDPPDAAGRRRIINDVFLRKIANLLLAFAEDKAVGYALYFFTYSTFLARPTLYLEDIYVEQAFRKKGIGLALFRKCAEEASRNNCGRLEFSVLTWNRNAIRFYEALAARRLNKWYYYRLNKDAIERLARTKARNLKQKSRRA